MHHEMMAGRSHFFQEWKSDLQIIEADSGFAGLTRIIHQKIVRDLR